MMIQHERCEVGGITLHVASAGQGPTLLFLHGFPEFWFAWRHQLAALADDFRVVAPDLPGYNESDKPLGLDPYRLPALVDCIAGLIDRLQAAPVVLIGHDWGGAVAWALAAWRPDLLRKLVIINMAHPVLFRRELSNNPLQQKASAYIFAFMQPQAEDMLAANDHARIARMVFEGSVFTEAEQQAYRAAWRQPGALTAGLNYYRAAPLNDDAMVHRLKRPIKVPTMVIWGERDTALLPGNLDDLDTLVPDLQLHRVPDATHWIVHEKPDLVNALIRQFAGGNGHS